MAALAVPFASAAPDFIEQKRYSGPDVTPCPACLSAAPNGDLYVGVDLNGSLGKGANKGRIVKLVDTNGDGQPDKHTVFADLDNPRGLIAVGTKLFALHTVIPKDTGVMSEMNLSVLVDEDQDGVADGPPKTLIHNVSTLKSNQKRGADHTTNGIRMGIDGWIYIAVGDFGFVDAEGTDGTKMTMLGGGILRVRPDGGEMEAYTLGLRNIYDVAIDPFMNLYTRGNTNDGGGWNVRFIHQIQSGEYGYPRLYINFPEEIIPALVDLGGGSGTGALFMDEPTWPKEFNKVPMMADWGRSQLFIHRLKPDGPSFTQQEEKFLACQQDFGRRRRCFGSDVSRRLEWCRILGESEEGLCRHCRAQGGEAGSFPGSSQGKAGCPRRHGGIDQCHGEASCAAGAAAEEGEGCSAGPVGHGQGMDRNTLRPGWRRSSPMPSLERPVPCRDSWSWWRMIRYVSLPCVPLPTASPFLSDVPLEPFLAGLKDPNPRVQVAAAVGLGRLGRKEAAEALLAVSNPPGVASAEDTNDFKSKAITGDQRVKIEVDISDFHELHLIVDDEGGIGLDHAAWVNPVLIDADGRETPVTKVRWKSKTSGWGKVNIDKDCTGKPLADTKGNKLKGIGTHARSVIVCKLPPGKFVGFKAEGCLTKGSNGRGKVSFEVAQTSSPQGGAQHATPNSPIILPHVAVRALIALDAQEACLAAVDGPNRDGALWALRWMHSTAVVDGLVSKLESTADAAAQKAILATLARLYQREAPYDGSWWWSTRPDTRGPYYKPERWDGSGAIEGVFRAIHASAKDEGKAYLEGLANRNRMNLEGIGKVEVADKKPNSKKGEIGRTSIEDVMLALAERKGNPKKGAKVIQQLSCVGCHNIKPGRPDQGTRPDEARKPDEGRNCRGHPQAGSRHLRDLGEREDEGWHRPSGHLDFKG